MGIIIIETTVSEDSDIVNDRRLAKSEKSIHLNKEFTYKCRGSGAPNPPLMKSDAKASM